MDNAFNKHTDRLYFKPIVGLLASNASSCVDQTSISRDLVSSKRFGEKCQKWRTKQGQGQNLLTLKTDVQVDLRSHGDGEQGEVDESEEAFLRAQINFNLQNPNVLLFWCISCAPTAAEDFTRLKSFFMSTARWTWTFILSRISYLHFSPQDSVNVATMGVSAHIQMASGG